MTGINMTGANVSVWLVGAETMPVPASYFYVGWQAAIHEYGWWLLIVMGVLFAAFLYQKHIVLGLMVMVTCAVNIWWIEYADIPAVPMILARCIFILLIVFCLLFWLQARRVRYGTGDT